MAEKLTGETAEKQKFTPRQNIGSELDPGKSQKVSPDNGSTHNGMSKAPLIEKSKPEPSKSHQPPAGKDKPETKTAPWRQGRSSQQVEEKVEKKVVSKREEQEKKVQEFLRDPSAPAGSTVPLEVRLRKPGVEKEAEDITEVGGNLLLAPHSILSRLDLPKLLEAQRVTSVIETSTSRTSLQLPPKIHHTHLKVPIGGLDSSAFTSISKSTAVQGRHLVVCSEGLGPGALLCAASLVKVKGLTVEKALAEVTSVRRCTLPAGLRLQLEEWASPSSSSLISSTSFASLIASWLPLLVVGLLLYLAWRQLTITVEENHRNEEALTPYSYFHILTWP